MRQVQTLTRRRQQLRRPALAGAVQSMRLPWRGLPSACGIVRPLSGRLCPRPTALARSFSLAISGISYTVFRAAALADWCAAVARTCGRRRSLAEKVGEGAGDRRVREGVSSKDTTARGHHLHSKNIGGDGRGMRRWTREAREQIDRESD